MTFDRICGKCGAPISSEDASCPKCPPTVPPKKAEAIPALLVFAVLVTSLLMLGTSVVNVVNAPDPGDPAPPAVVMTDRKAAAYEAARNFIQERFPGDKEFADLDQSVVKEDGDKYLVTISADELQGTSPARHLYKVELHFVDGSWVVKDIRR